MKIFPQRLLIV